MVILGNSWDEDKSSRLVLEALRGGAVPPFQTTIFLVDEQVIKIIKCN